MRYICLDTETTGLNYLTGDRVFEVGCVEIIDRKKTGNVFRELLDPLYPLSEASKQICKVEDDDLKGKPLFVDIADNLLNFLYGNYDPKETIILIHNAKFDTGFVNNELTLAGKKTLDDFTIIDTLQIARVKDPGGSASLNFLAKKFNIDLSGREEKGHGALLDADILADIFLRMCADDDDDFIKDAVGEDVLFFGIYKQEQVVQKRDFALSEDDLANHKKLLLEIKAEEW